MKRLLRNSLAAAAFVGTGLLLVADSARECNHPPESVRFAVSGDCGAPGVLTVASGENDCGLQVTGAEALSLPTTGDYGSKPLAERDWRLYGATTLTVANDAGMPPGDGGAQDGGTVDAGVTTVGVDRTCDFADEADGGRVLRCIARGLDGVETRCTAILTPQP